MYLRRSFRSGDLRKSGAGIGELVSERGIVLDAVGSDLSDVIPERVRGGDEFRRSDDFECGPGIADVLERAHDDRNGDFVACRLTLEEQEERGEHLGVREHADDRFVTSFRSVSSRLDWTEQGLTYKEGRGADKGAEQESGGVAHYATVGRPS